MLFIGSPPSGLKWQQGGRRDRARAGTASRSLNLANLTSFALSLAMSARWCAPRGFDAVSVATASTASRGDRHTHHRRRRDDSSHRAVANQRTRIGGRLRSSTLEGVSSTQEAGYYDIARRDGIIQVRSYTVTKGYSGPTPIRSNRAPSIAVGMPFISVFVPLMRRHSRVRAPRTQRAQSQESRFSTEMEDTRLGGAGE